MVSSEQMQWERQSHWKSFIIYVSPRLSAVKSSMTTGASSAAGAVKSGQLYSYELRYGSVTPNQNVDVL